MRLWVYVAPTGQVPDREAILGMIRSPRYRLHHWTRTNVVVRMLGEIASVIRHRWRGEGEFEGKPLNWSIAFPHIRRYSSTK